jgi:hypothetical protein
MKLIKKLGLHLGFFGVLSFLILTLIPKTEYTPHFLSPTNGQVLGAASNKSPEALVFAALPESKNQTQTSFQTNDARPEIIRQYLEYYNSPLVPYANLIVQLSDENNFDYRWMVAIAQQESNLCKRIPPNSHNCWGWGIYGDKVTRFDSYEDALVSIAPQFKEIFLKDKHSKDPYEVMQTYTPPSDGSWAKGVLQFFTDLE